MRWMQTVDVDVDQRRRRMFRRRVTGCWQVVADLQRVIVIPAIRALVPDPPQRHMSTLGDGEAAPAQRARNTPYDHTSNLLPSIHVSCSGCSIPWAGQITQSTAQPGLTCATCTASNGGLSRDTRADDRGRHVWFPILRPAKGHVAAACQSHSSVSPSRTHHFQRLLHSSSPPESFHPALDGLVGSLLASQFTDEIVTMSLRTKGASCQ